MRRLGTLSKEELLNRIELLENQASSRTTYDEGSPILSQQDDDWEPNYDSTQELPSQERTRQTPRFSPEISTTLPTTREPQRRSIGISNEQQGTHHQETIWKTDPEIRRQILTTYLESMHRRVPFCDYTEILHTNELGPDTTISTDVGRVKLLRLYMSCAIGAAVMQLTGVSPGPRPEIYFSRALELRDEIEGTDLVTQTEILLWIVLYKLRACFSSEVWYLIGSAVRTAIDADLHREHHYTSLAPVSAERHRCLFWAVYVIERNICWSLKRPFSLSDHDIDAKLPTPTTHPIIPGNDNSIRPELQTESSRPLDTRVFISIIQLGRINSNAFTQLHRVDRELIDREQIPPLLDRLYQFEASLPDYSAPDYDFLQLHVKKSVCVLIEPLLSTLHHSDYLIKTCLEAAGSVCQLFKKLRLKRCLGYSFTMINSVFVAGTTIW